MVYLPQTQPDMLPILWFFTKFTGFGCHHHNSLSKDFHYVPKNPLVSVVLSLLSVSRSANLGYHPVWSLFWLAYFIEPSVWQELSNTLSHGLLVYGSPLTGSWRVSRFWTLSAMFLWVQVFLLIYILPLPFSFFYYFSQFWVAVGYTHECTPILHVYVGVHTLVWRSDIDVSNHPPSFCDIIHWVRVSQNWSV